MSALGNAAAAAGSVGAGAKSGHGLDAKLDAKLVELMEGTLSPHAPTRKAAAARLDNLAAKGTFNSRFVFRVLRFLDGSGGEEVRC